MREAGSAHGPHPIADILEAARFGGRPPVLDGVAYSATASISPPYGLQDRSAVSFMDLYIHRLYVLVSKILSSILNSPTLIHPLYHPLSTLSTVTLSKYIHE
jgi:hypothetical protein